MPLRRCRVSPLPPQPSMSHAGVNALTVYQYPRITRMAQNRTQIVQVVEAITRRVGPRHRPRFMGIGGCMDMLHSWGALPCAPFIRYFLNASNHKRADVPIDAISIHFYASSNSRRSPDTCEPPLTVTHDFRHMACIVKAVPQPSGLSSHLVIVSHPSATALNTCADTVGFFGAADDFIAQMTRHAAVRDEIAPHVEIAISELGVLYRDEVARLFRSQVGGWGVARWAI